MKSTLELLEWPELCELLSRYAECAPGRELVRRLKPARSLPEVRETGAAVDESMDLLRDRQRPLLVDVVDLAPLLDRARQQTSAMEPADLYRTARTMRCAEHLRDLLREARDRFPCLWERAAGLPRLKELRQQLERTVDAGGRVLDEASPDLARVRRELEAGEREVRLLAEKVAARAQWQSVLRGGPPVLRDGRFMVAVKAESRGNVPGVLHDRSASGATVFVEPRELVEPQNRLADVRSRERQLVAAVLLQVTRDVLRKDGEIRELLRLLGRFDALFARARYGLEASGRRVTVTAEGSLQLREARHPLLLERERAGEEGAGGWDQARRRVVPFDLELGGEFDVLVITGPNTGGKTVALKAIGLVSCMALAAIPAPVGAESQVPFFGSVHADIGDEQDLAQNLSTFSGHLRRIASILRQVRRGGLVLLDELGSGTDPREGEALGDALLTWFLRHGVLVVATTHLSRLKDLGYDHPRIENASLEFDPGSLQPLFRLTLGLPGESNALLIARRLGLPEPILEAAGRKVRPEGSEELVRITAEVQRSRIAARQHLERAEEESRQAHDRRRDLEAKISELEARNEVLESQKQREIDRELRAARDRGLALLREAGKLPREVEERLRPLIEHLTGMATSTGLAERRTAFVLTLRKDDPVYLPRYKETCRVRKVDRVRQVLTVLYRSFPLEVAFSEVACPDDFEVGGPRDV